MPDVADNLRSASTQISELGSLESSLSVDLATQATKFDEAWATIDTNPEKSLKALAEQTTKLTTEANLADNDRAKDTARNFATDIQDLSRLRLELNAAKARKDQKSIDRLQTEYSTANYRARNTYEYWRRGDVEQYKLNLDKRKKKQQQAADEVQQAIDALDREIGNEGNEQFTQLRAALQTVQSALRSGASTSNISLPGASKFDPKKGNFSSYFENWKRRNRIDETDLRKPNSTQKTAEKTKDKQEEQQQTRSTRNQQRTAIKKQVEAANIQAKAAAIAAVSSGAVATKTATTATSAAAVTTAAAQATPASSKSSPSTTKAPLKQEQQNPQQGRVEQKQAVQTPQATQTQAGAAAKTIPSPTTQRTIPTNTSTPTPTPTEAIQKIEQQQLGRIAQRNDIRGSGQTTTTTTTTTTNQEITFTGKIGRRLEKNVAEFEQVKQRIVQIQADMETKTVSDPELIQELDLQIQQAIEIRQALIGDATVQIEATLEQSPAQAAAVAAALVASVAGAVQFTTLAATAQANRADSAGLPVPQPIRIASKLNSSDIQGLEDLAQAASKATITATTNGGKEDFRIQSSADQTLKHLNHLVGDAALDASAAQQIQQFSNPLQLKASASGVHDAQRLASHAEQYRQAAEQNPLQTAQAIKTNVDTDQDFELPSPEEAALAFQPIGQTAGIGRKPGQLGTLPPKTRIGTGMASALALQSQQRAEQIGLERNHRDLLGDTGLSDNSILDDTGLEPVLRLYDRSYTDQQVPQISAPIAGGDIETGGGYIQSESDQTRRARELQQAQYQSRRSLVGGENTYLGLSAQNLAAIEAAAGLGGLRGQIGEDVSGYVLADRADRESDEQSLEGDEGDQARQLMSQQLAQMRQKALSDARKKLQDKIKNQIKATAKKAAQKSAAAATRVTVETAQAVAGPEDAGITWITLIIEMNLQLILKYVLKGFGFIGSQAIKTDRESGIEGNIVQEVNDFADSIQTFWEDVLTIWMDCCLQIASCIQMCGPFILIILSFILFFGGSLFGALEIFNSFSTK